MGAHLAPFVYLAAFLQTGDASAGRVPEPVPVSSDTLVGAYYFPGWSDVSRWYCIKASAAAQHPLLGYYREGDPRAADWHIKWALEHGVSFFAFDHYVRAGAETLEAALADGFLRSAFIDRFRFCLNWCNHAPPETQTAEELELFADTVIPKYLAHPSYLRIDGKPVVMILAGNSFVKTLGVDGARDAFGRFDTRCRDAGLGGVYLVFCEGEVHGAEDLNRCLSAGVQAFCLYNYPYAGSGLSGPGTYAEAPYADLLEQGRGLWRHWSALTEGRFWPTVMPGWDRRPWTKDQDLVRTGSTPELFAQALAEARAHVNDQRIVFIEAWNEWGEGSVLEPSVEWGFAYLDAVRDTFCPDAGQHEDTHPQALGLPKPEFEFELPCTDAWRFDFGADGWAPKDLADFRAEHGAIEGTSTSNDCQLMSSPTYLRCADYDRITIRMLARATEGGPPTCTGQVFWTTVDRAWSEELSATFQVPLDGRWHEHTVDLVRSPAWTGMADRIRLDPVDVAGVAVRVDSIRLMHRG